MTSPSAAAASEPLADWVAGYPAQVTDRHPGVVLSLHRMDAEHVCLTQLAVPEAGRGRGLGTAIMAGLLALADDHRDTVICTPIGKLATDARWLRRWCRGFGFVANTGRNRQFDLPDIMYHRPDVQPRRKRVITPPTDTAAVHDITGQQVAELPAQAASPDDETRQVLARLHHLELRPHLDRGHWMTRRTTHLTFGVPDPRHVHGDMLINAVTGRLRRGCLKVPWQQSPIPLFTPDQWLCELDRNAEKIRRNITQARRRRHSPT